MFELLSNIQSVPIDREALTMIHHGMNKVRVSVGEHNSEPSEVYIITGRADSNLETYIIFYMLEPGIHVVYGFDQNPYDPAFHEKVLEEATTFVEEMGSILEEVPLQTMTPEQRAAWFDKEVLYSGPVVDELDEIDELEEIEELEIADIEEDQETLTDADEEPESGAIVEISDEEVQEVLAEEGVDDITGESYEDLDPEDSVDDETAGEDLTGVDSARSEDVVVAEGDFDELLKQAFLKPDVVEKTRKISAKQGRDPAEEDLLPHVEAEDGEEDKPYEQSVDAADQESAQEADVEMSAGGDPDPEPEGEIDAEPGVDPEGKFGTSGDAPEQPLEKGKVSIEVIRYLSKF